MEWWETIWNAIVESGVDRVFGAVCRFVLPRGQRCLSALWRRSRPSLAADYAAARSAPLYRKVVFGVMMLYIVGATVAFGHTTGWAFDDDVAPLWSLAWFVSLSVAAWLYAGWLGVRWTVRRARRAMA